MMSTSILLASLTAGLFTLVCANPSPFGLGRRTDPDNTVVVNSEDNYWYDHHTLIILVEL